MKQTLPYLSLLATLATGVTTAPASAAYCGIPDDLKPVVKLTIATYPKISHTSQTIGENSVRTVSVNGTYAYSVTDVGGKRIQFYWEKPTGTWQFASANKWPAGWPKELQQFLENGDCNR